MRRLLSVPLHKSSRSFSTLDRPTFGSRPPRARRLLASYVSYVLGVCHLPHSFRSETQSKHSLTVSCTRNTTLPRLPLTRPMEPSLPSDTDPVRSRDSSRKTLSPSETWLSSTKTSPRLPRSQDSPSLSVNLTVFSVSPMILFRSTTSSRHSTTCSTKSSSTSQSSPSASGRLRKMEER